MATMDHERPVSSDVDAHMQYKVERETQTPVKMLKSKGMQTLASLVMKNGEDDHEKMIRDLDKNFEYADYAGESSFKDTLTRTMVSATVSFGETVVGRHMKCDSRGETMNIEPEINFDDEDDAEEAKDT